MEYKKWFNRMQKGVETETTDVSRSTTHTKVVSPATLQCRVFEPNISCYQKRPGSLI